MAKIYHLISVFIFLLVGSSIFSHTNFEKERPFIWVQKKDKADILQKIETEEWANSFYKQFTSRLAPEIEKHQNNTDVFLQELPFDHSDQYKNTIPPFLTFTKFDDANSEQRQQISKKLKVAVDAGVLYFLTEDQAYAQCALDILHTIIESILKITPSNHHGNGGWIYPNDHLREARIIGAQIPIIYDFVYPYLQKGGKPYDISKKSKTRFNFENAQKVFRTYARLAVDHGHRGSNWSVLEATSLVHNTLALEDPQERRHFLNFFLKKGSAYQESLPEIAERFKNEGDVFPETSQYSNGVSSIATKLMVLLSKYDPSLQLGKKYYKIPWALNVWDLFRYPNDEIIRFGDGHRTYESDYVSYEIAYTLGTIDTVPKLRDKFEPLLSNSISTGKYKRDQLKSYNFKPEPYDTPLRLLWFSENFDKPLEKESLPRTAFLPHAGIHLQRNLSSIEKPENGLMCFVGGGHCVHGHANGMDMELYGQGLVLGVDGGRGKYRTELHENYSRLYASHNTVIVNGASQGEGGWVQLGINTLQRLAMEPLPLQDALSSQYSFTRTGFKDDKGQKAEATQERTLALIRTSPITGYYVDVFRSKSALPNQYHDYVYHNIGDELQFLNTDISLSSDPGRYQANAKDEWIRNRKYRNPGWHYFKKVQTSKKYAKDVTVQFKIAKFKEQEILMNLFIPGAQDRQYTKVVAPPTFEAPKPYDQLPTPTLVIRKEGEAWQHPFAVIYEPTRSEPGTLGIQSVSKLEQDGVFKGFTVKSNTSSGNITQYIITQSTDERFTSSKPGLTFEGGFAIITEDGQGKLKDIYIGDGNQLRFKDIIIETKDTKDISAYIDFSGKEPKISSNNIKNLVISKK